VGDNGLHRFGASFRVRVGERIVELAGPGKSFGIVRAPQGDR
jgi:hypothetical protein